jgi:hypothetical protein
MWFQSSARLVVGVENSGCEGDKGITAGRVTPEGSDEALKEFEMDVSLGRRPTDDTRESFSSGEGICSRPEGSGT